ncbi:WD40-repeat-containing domain protein [Mucor mucedo]|uniref:WD40-repeat-containing domain protein n=1 Tax=Mucor mucedo TaxID=29922 RepID=UPI00221F9173|nr:WD40-repeat-containing domain protein [Mucor mucedo]KAI7874607.1 WD40-repeat-containing domain protein [Mucor mucedo]
MRSTPGVPLTIAELQLSSPLPSPSRQSVLNNHAHTLSNIINNKSSSSSSLATNSYNSTPDLASISTLSKSVMLPPLQFEQPNSLHPDLYPLTTANTPNAMKKFTFLVDGRPCLFEEVNTSTVTNTPRKRSASIWDDDRSFKRTELDNEAPDNLPTNASSPNDNMPDSPNSALPSPVSDLDESFYSVEEDEDMMIEQQITATELTTTTATTTTTAAMDTDSLIDTFDMLPDNIQTYFMFQLLKRSPRHALRLANATIMQVLKSDILLKLPPKLATIVLSYLDVRSLCRAASVNKMWYTLIENASTVWELKMRHADFKPSTKELMEADFKKIVKRHTIMRRNWKLNRHDKLILQGHEEDLVTCLQFDDEKIITTGSDDHSINVYDIKTGESITKLTGHDGGVWALQYVGNTLVTGSIDRTVRVWDIKEGRCRYILRGHLSTVRCLKIVMPEMIVQPDGSSRLEPSEPIIISGSRDTTIRVWKLPNLETEDDMPLSTCVEDDMISEGFLKYKLAEHDHSVRDLAVHGNILVSGSYDNSVIVWDLETGTNVHTLKGHTMKVYCVSIDPKRRHCISGSLDASVRIWGLDDGECKFVLQGHSILVGLLGLVDDCLVSAAADTTLRIWDPSNGDRLHILAGSSGHQGPITSFQHDRHKIISGSEGGVKMWDTQTGKLLHDLVEGAASIWRVSFDERRCIAAVKNDNKTQLVVLDYGVYGLE